MIKIIIQKIQLYIYIDFLALTVLLLQFWWKQ